MKEKIYTIPVNEAFEADCECPFCVLERKLESEAVDYALGAAMMEPDNRIESNKKGFCGRHFKMLYDYPNRLGLALVLDTHLQEIRKRLERYDKRPAVSGGLFRKKPVSAQLTEELSAIRKPCVICERIDHTMERYEAVSAELWADEEDFRKKFENSKGVCLKHFEELCRAAENNLRGAKAEEFIAFLCAKQKKELERIQEDIHKFTLKFDYRNADMPWGTAKDAPVRCVEKINGYITSEDEKEQ
ncbi:MAG: ABC transporter substrate-binding protein [Oscillospiraceae bacterium]|nr:ABC transporter substrate-binding protein [Oscillospiraceae bacterium]